MMKCPTDQTGQEQNKNHGDNDKHERRALPSEVTAQPLHQSLLQIAETWIRTKASLHWHERHGLKRHVGGIKRRIKLPETHTSGCLPSEKNILKTAQRLQQTICLRLLKPIIYNFTLYRISILKADAKLKTLVSCWYKLLII